MEILFGFAYGMRKAIAMVFLLVHGLDIEPDLHIYGEFVVLSYGSSRHLLQVVCVQFHLFIVLRHFDSSLLKLFFLPAGSE